VRRALAPILISALAATSSLVSLHAHASRDHDHPEHHHGLSAHEHHLTPGHPDDDIARLEECDPAAHVVPFVFVCVAPHQVHHADAEPNGLAAFSLQLRIELAIGWRDVRVHGPPTRTDAPPRAPPLIFPA
jgi:hypothetical protein